MLSQTLAEDAHPLRLLQGGAGGTVDALLDALARVHAVEDGGSIEMIGVEAVERAMPGAAAAVFALAEDVDLLTLRAAGPRWRTAERDGPPWLTPLAGEVARTARAPQPLRGRLLRTVAAVREVDVIQVPLCVPGRPRGALVVVWPPLCPAREGDFWWVDRFGAHLELALRRHVRDAEVQGVLIALRRAQADLVRSQQVRAVGALAAGVVHDLNNSLTTILGLSDWLLQAPGLEADARADIEAVRAAGGDVKSLSDHLAFMARQARPGHRVRLELCEVLNAALAAIGPAVAQRERSRTRVTLDVDQRGGHTAVVGDLLQLGDLVAHLLHTALAATPAGGRIAIGLEADGDLAQILVADQGCGFDAAAQAEIFDPVYSKARSWLNLGLSACWGIADSHGGRLTADTLRDGGRLVTLALPAAPSR